MNSSWQKNVARPRIRWRHEEPRRWLLLVKSQSHGDTCTVIFALSAPTLGPMTVHNDARCPQSCWHRAVCTRSVMLQAALSIFDFKSHNTKIIRATLKVSQEKKSNQNSMNWIPSPWSRVLPEKLTGPQLLKKFPVFYRIGRFIVALTTARHLIPVLRTIQSLPPHPTSRRSILILSTHLSLYLPNSLLPSGFPTKALYAHLLPNTC